MTTQMSSAPNCTSQESLIDVLRFVRDYHALTAGETPSLARIQRSVCPLLSRESVRSVLTRLADHGLITRYDNDSVRSVRSVRPIELTTKGCQLLESLSATVSHP